jgi:hypothetical protein
VEKISITMRINKKKRTTTSYDKEGEEKEEKEEKNAQIISSQKTHCLSCVLNNI